MAGYSQKGRLDSCNPSIKIVRFDRDDNSEPPKLLAAKLRSRHHIDFVIIEQLLKEFQLCLLRTFVQEFA